MGRLHQSVHRACQLNASQPRQIQESHVQDLVGMEGVLDQRGQIWDDLEEHKHRRLAVAGTKELEVVPSRVEDAEADRQVAHDGVRVMRKACDRAWSRLGLHLVFEEALA